MSRRARLVSRRAPTCHPERKHEAKGLCVACYMRARRANPEIRARDYASNAQREHERVQDPEYRAKRYARDTPARRNARQRALYALRKAQAK